MAWHRLAADLVVVFHCAFVAFVVLVVPLAWIGRWRQWAWTQRPLLRFGHLAAIGYVVFATALGAACPLTRLENHLREGVGQATYPGSFIGYWAHELLFFDFSPRVFVIAYALFGVAVVLTLWLAPPKFSTRRATH